MSILLDHINASLPPVDSTPYREKNKKLFAELGQSCIIIDDDPTGNQTVYDIPLLTEWETDTIAQEFLAETPAFFLLTNSRSLEASKVANLYQTIIQNILKAADLTKRKFTIISRSDSTLRGHFPLEIDTLKKFGGFKNSITVFIPVMFEGGRVTVNNTHYVVDELKAIPVSDTAFSKDHTFRYTHSNLKDWIEEKTEGFVSASEVHAISIEAIRTENTQELSRRIASVEKDTFCIINALNYQDLDKISYALLQATQSGCQILYRTSSSFVPSYVGQPTKTILEAKNLGIAGTDHGGLIVVGSYVSKTSLQLKHLLSHWNTENSIEIAVEKLLTKKKEEYLSTIVDLLNQKLSSGKDVIIYTSRTLLKGKDQATTIQIASQISAGLISIVQDIKTTPRYILTKGGITSHDIATKGLSMKRSMVLGQILLGVPVWKMGKETKFPGLPYIVFPGNVGDKNALYTVTQKLSL